MVGNATTKHCYFNGYIMTKKHYKIQSQESYWLEALSLFTDGCLNEAEIKQYKKDLAKRLADLVKNNCVLDDVIKCENFKCNNKAEYFYCNDCENIRDERCQ